MGVERPERTRVDSAHGAAATSTAARFPPLDGLRGVAILLVLVHHCWFTTDGSALGRLLAPLIDAGWIGVNLFFVLSGFLITGILLESKGQPSYYRTFYMRRVLRIFPLYYTVLLVHATLVGFWTRRFADGTLMYRPAAWPVWMFLTNWPDALPVGVLTGALMPLWSLAVEEQVYLVLPAVIAAFDRRWLLRGFVAVLPLALVWRVAILCGLAPAATAYAGTLSCLDAFAAGGVGALLTRGVMDRYRLHRLACVAAAGASLCLTAMATRQGHFYVWRDMYGILSVGLTLLSLAFGALIVACVTAEPGWGLNRFLSSRVLRSFGRLSFALYLLHMPIFGVVRPNLVLRLGSAIPSSSFAMSVQAFLVTLAVTYLCARLSWRFIESPALRWKAAFPTSGRAVPEAALESHSQKLGRPHHGAGVLRRTRRIVWIRRDLP